MVQVSGLQGLRFQNMCDKVDVEGTIIDLVCRSLSFYIAD